MYRLKKTCLVMLLMLFVLVLALSACANEETQVRITFIVDGKTYKTVTLEKGAGMTEIPEIPQKDTYAGRWDCNNFGKFTEDTTVTAVYVKNVYSVVFMADGEEIDRQTVALGSEPVIPDIPEKSGYEAEWSVTDFSETNEDKTVQAVYTPKTVRFTFKVMGMSFPQNIYVTRNITFGTPFTDLPAVPEREGYDGVWNITDFSGIAVDTDVFAVYTKKNYTVTLLHEGYTDHEEDSRSVTHGEVFESISSGTREGYLFCGWYYDAAFLNEVVFPVTVTENSRFYARWLKSNLADVGSDIDAYSFTLLDDGTYSVKADGTVSLQNLIIPNCYSGKPVTVIADDAFKGATSVRKVVVPSEVKLIGKNAFLDCTNLNTLLFERNAVETVGNYAFAGTKINSVSLPFTVKEIGEYAFFGDDNLTNLIFTSEKSSELTKIGKHAFDGCSNLSSLTLGEKLEEIGEYAFNGVSKAQFTFKSYDNIKNVGEKAFYGCSMLKNFNASGVVSLGKEAFGKCGSMQSVTVSGDKVLGYYFGTEAYAGGYAVIQKTRKIDAKGKYILDSNDLYTYDNTTYYVPSSLITVTTTKLCDGLVEYAFYDCHTIRNVILNAAIRTIGDYAFGISVLDDSNNMSANVLNFGEDCLLEEIGEGAFYNRYALSVLTFPEKLSIIGDYAFYNCSGLNTVHFEDENAVDKVGRSAFEKTAWFDALPKGVVYIGSVAFGLAQKEFYFEDTSIAVKEGTVSISPYAFADLVKIVSVSLPSTLKTIGEYAFANNNSVLSVNLKDGIEEIGNGAFSSNKVLERINIPSSVNKIGEGILSGCERLAELTVVGNDLVGKLFGTVSYPESYEAVQDTLDETNEGENPVYNPIAYYVPKSLIKLTVAAPEKEGAVIAPYAFKYLSGVSVIILPEGITEIGEGAFYGCGSLGDFDKYYAYERAKAVARKNGLPLEGEELSLLRQNCISDLTLRLPSTLIKIQEDAFNGNGKLQYVSFEVDSELEEIGESAFEGCGFINLEIPSNVKLIGKNAFRLNEKLVSLSFEEGSEALTISDGAFLLNTAMINAVMPDRLVSLGVEAFSGNNMLTTFVLSENSKLTAIGQNAFLNNSALTELTIPEGVRSEIKKDEVVVGYEVACLNILNGASSLRELTVYNELIAGKLFGTVSYDRSYAVVDGVDTYYVPSALVTVNILGGKVKDKAFKNFTSLRSVLFSELTEIGQESFSNCRNVLNISLPRSLTKIGDRAFENCGSLVTLSMYAEGEVEEIGEGAFYGASSLTSAVLPSSLEVISPYLFYDCVALNTLKMPENCYEIGDYAFYDCRSLKRATLSESLTRIGKNAFYNCGNCDFPFVIMDELSEIDDFAFYGCKLLEIINAENLERIGTFAFSGCGALTEIGLSANTTVGNTFGSAYYEGSYAVNQNGDYYVPYSLKVVRISSKAESIPSYAFKNLSLERIVVYPEVPPRYGDEVFEGISSAKIFVPYSSYTTYTNDWSGFGLNLYAFPVPDEYFEYTQNLDGTYSIGAKEGSVLPPVVSLPQSYDGKTITAVSAAGFYGNGEISELIIPPTVTVIGNSAFKNCVNLQNLVFETGSRIKTIESDAFSSCPSLVGVNFPDGLESIGDYAFFGARSYNQVTGSYDYSSALSYIGFNKSSSVKSIGQYAFGYSAGLTELYLPASLTDIGTGAFIGSGMTTLTIADDVNLTEIPSLCFSDCASLTGVSIPYSIEKIASSAFSSCVALKKVVCVSGLTEIEKRAFYNCSALESVVLPDGLTKIGEEAFRYATSLKSLTVPSSVSEIENRAFSDCTFLVEVTFKNVETLSLGENVFQNTEWYETVYAEKPDGIVYVDNIVYEYKGTMPLNTVLTIDGNATAIAPEAFRNQTNLKGIIIPSSVKEIGDSAFTDSGLSELTLNSGLIKIGAYAFKGTAITEVTLPETLKSIGAGAFEGLSLTALVLPQNGVLSEIGAYAFNGCDMNGIEIDLPLSVTKLGDYAFATVINSLTVTVAAEGSLSKIGKYAFKNVALDLNFPSVMKEIDAYAFANSTINDVIISNGIEKIGDFAFYNANVSSVVIAAEAALAEIGESALESLTETVFNIGYQQNLVSIGKNAFAGCKKLKVLRGSTVTIIGDGAFNGCDGLEELTVNGRQISEYYSSSSPSVTKLYIALGVETVSKEAYKGLTSLTYVGFSSTVNAIEESAFEDCTNLSELSFELEGNIGKVGRNAFADTLWENNLHQGINYVGAVVYKYISPASPESVSLRSNATYITDGAFKNTNVAGVTLPSSLSYIGDESFYGCGELVTVTLNSNTNVEYIGKEAFAYCVKLIAMTVTKSVKYIGEGILKSCPSLISLQLGKNVALPTFFGTESYEGSYTVEYSGITYYVPSALATVKFIDGVTEILDYAAANMTSLKNVNVSAGVKKIGDYAFYNATNLQEVIMIAGNELTDIGDFAFALTKIKSILFTDKLTSIGEGVLSGVPTLENIVVGGSYALPTLFGTEIFLNSYSVNYESKTYYLPIALTNVTVCEGTEEIVPSAFAGLRVRTFALPSTVEKIGANAFANGIAVRTVSIEGDVLSEIGEKAFYKLGLLEEISLPPSVSSIGVSCFEDCEKLAVINYTGSVFDIGVNAFLHTKWLSDKEKGAVYFGTALIAYTGAMEANCTFVPKEGTTSISNGVFAGFTQLVGFEFISSIVNVGEGVFKNCPNLSSVVFEEGCTLESIPKDTFYGCGIVNIVLPLSVKSIGDYAFYNCSELLGADIRSNLVSIGASAFEGTKLLEINVPSTVKTIGSGAFRNITGLNTVRFPVGEENQLIEIGDSAFEGADSASFTQIPFTKLTRVGASAFKNCGGLVGFEAPNVESIGNEAFYGCTGLASLSVVGDVFDYAAVPSSRTGYYRVGASYFPEALKKLVIAEGVTEIAANAYKGFTSLEEVVLPLGIRKINDSAFENCSSLKITNLPEGLISIGINAFNGAALTDVNLPSSLKTLSAAAFKNLVDNESVAAAPLCSIMTIGESAFENVGGEFNLGELNSLADVGENAFANCVKLTSFVAKNIRTIADNAFLGCNAISSVTIVGNKAVGGIFGGVVPASLNSVYVSDCTTNLADDVFNGLSTITDITLKNVTSIGKRAFANTSLASLTLPSGVINLKDEAFKNCSLLEELNFEENTLVQIGADVFNNCLWYDNLVGSASDGVIYIGRVAYAYKGVLSGVLTIAAGTISIASEAFAENVGLTEIRVPSSVINIGERAFYMCQNVAKVIVSGNISIGQLFGTDPYANSYVAEQNGVEYYIPTSLKVVEIIDGSRQIMKESMANMSSLTTVTIPVSVLTVGRDVLKSCSGINTLSMGGGYNIGRLFGTDSYSGSYAAEQNGVVYYLPNALATLTVLDGTDAISDYSYQNAVKIENIALPDSIERIGVRAFAGCVLLYDIHIPDSLTEIADYAFENCERFSSIAIPSNVVVGSGILKGAIALQTLAAGGKDNVGRLFGTESYAGSYSAQQGTSVYYIPGILLSVTLLDTVNVGNYALANMKNVTDVIMGNEVETIGNYSFAGLSALKRINVPSKVVSVGRYAFYNAKSATFTFGDVDNIKSVGDYAFAYCESLTEFCSGSIEEIGMSAFNGCSGLITLGILGNSKLGELFGSDRFPQSYVITQGGTNYYIPLNLKNLTVYNSNIIADNAFSGISSLTEIAFDDEITSIGSRAFENCSSLTSISLSSELISIGEYAFAGCTSLSEVETTDLSKLDGIGQNAFGDTSWYKTQTQKFVYLENWLLGYSGIMPVNSRLTIKDGTDRIADKALYDLTALAELTIPDSFEELENAVLTGCTSLVSLSVPFIGDSRNSDENVFYIFDGTPALEKITITDAISVPDEAVSGISSLKEIIVKDGVLEIGNRAFADNVSLITADLPSTVNTVGSDIFAGCYALKSLKMSFIGKQRGGGEDNYLGYSFGLTKGGDASSYAINELELISEDVIGEKAFYGFTSIKNLRLTGMIMKIEDEAFFGLRLENEDEDDVRVNLGTLNSLSDDAFLNAFVREETSAGVWEDRELFDYLAVQASEVNKVKYLGYIVVGCEIARVDNVTLEPGTTQLYTYTDSLGVTDGAFAQAVGLKSINFPASLIKIGKRAFENCSSLVSVQLPANVTTIGDYAFSGCTKLTSVSILDNVNEIGENAFLRCPISLLTVSNNNTSYKSVGDSLYNKRGTALIKYASGKSTTYNFTVPNDVETIMPYAFAESGSLFSLIIGNNVLSIGENALLGCTSLTSLSISAENAGLYGAPVLDTLNVNCGSVIADYAIKNSVAQNIIIGYTVSQIGAEAFADCSELRTVIFGATPAGTPSVPLVIKDGAFKNCVSLNGDTGVVLPSRVSALGNYVFSGCSSLTRVAIPESITVISEGLFENTAGMVGFNVPSFVTEIGAKAFRNSNIRNIIFADGSLLSRINASAFEDCSMLTSVSLPSGVTTLGEKAFKNCTSLESVLSLGGISRISTETFMNCSILRVVAIPNTVNTIGNSAFENCTELNDVYLPTSLITVNSLAFSGINGLKVYVNIATPPTSVASDAFNVVNVEIYVPTDKVDLYKSVWTTYAACISGYNFE